MAEKALDKFEKARKRSVSFLERTDSPSLVLSVSGSKDLNENIEKIDVCRHSLLQLISSWFCTRTSVYHNYK